MNFSYYEVYVNALRAFSGMGFPYGADEDAAFIIAWLELNNLYGVKLFVNSIDNIDRKYDGKIKLSKKQSIIDFKKSLQREHIIEKDNQDLQEEVRDLMRLSASSPTTSRGLNSTDLPHFVLSTH